MIRTSKSSKTISYSWHLCDAIEQKKKGMKDFPQDRLLPFDADVVVVSQSDVAF